MSSSPAGVDESLIDGPFNDGTIVDSELTNATISIYSDKVWYKNNSNVKMYGTLAATESVDSLTIVMEIYFESEGTPTYTFYNTTDASGNYEYTFLMSGTQKEGNFTIYVGVVGESSPINHTSYKYDGTAPAASTITALSEYTDTNPTLTWLNASDNNVSASQLTYSIYRAVKTVGSTPVPGDYSLINNSVTTNSWNQTGTLTTNRDYFYIVSVRDLAGNAANYTSVNTTYDVSKPIISSIISPITSGVYANTLNITARVTDSINFTVWAHVANATINSSQIDLSASGYNNEYTTVWSIPGSFGGTYNITIYANDSLGHLRISSNVTFEITTLAPFFFDLTDNSPTYYENGSVTVRVMIESSLQATTDVDDVILIYSTDSGYTTSYNITMDLLNGTVDDGYYNATLPTYDYYLYSNGPRTRVYYKVWANDTFFHNANITSSTYYDVEDDISPDFAGWIQSPSTVQFFNEVTININVTEPTIASGVDLSIAYLEYWNGTGGARTNLTLSNRGGDKFNALFQSFLGNEKIPAFNHNDDIYYRVWARDQEGNWNHTANYTYTVADDYAPEIINQGLLNTPINYNETGNIYANFTDVYANTTTLSSGINEGTVQLNYTINGGTQWQVVSMVKLYGNSSKSSWGYNISDLAYDTVVIYNFLISDNENNQLLTSNYTYVVVDQDAPTYSNLQAVPASPTYRGSINVSLVPSEPVNASGVRYLQLSFVNTSGSQSPVNMSLSGSTYYFVISKQDYGQTINITINIYDNVLPTSNVKTITGFSLFIDDYTAPTFSEPVLNDLDSNIQYYEVFNISVNATDLTPGDSLPSGILNITLEYDISGSLPIRVLMNRTSGDNYNGTWNAVLPSQHYGERIGYDIFVYDVAGNVGNLGGRFEDIFDDRNPTFDAPVVQSPPVEYDEQTNITIHLLEELVPKNSSGISSAVLHYVVDAGSELQISFNLVSGTIHDGYWSAILPLLAYDSVVVYNISFQDVAGNTNNTSNYTFTIDDLKDPTIISVDDGGIHYYYDVVQVEVNVTEIYNSSGVASVFLNYSVDSGSNIQVPMSLSTGNATSGNWTATIPTQDYSSVIRYNITAIDVSGNSAFSPQNYTYTVQDNVIPEMDVPVHQDTNNIDGNIEYFEDVEILIGIREISEPTESSGVNIVTLNYSTDGLIWNQIIMDKISAVGGNFDNTWNHTFVTGTFTWNTTVQYNIIVVDVAGNQNSSGTYSFFVTDLQASTTANLKNINAPALYYVQSNITVDLFEPALASGIENATLQYSETGVIWSNISASRANGTIYSGTWSALLPYFDYGVSLQVRYLIYDRQGNSKTTAPIAISVGDDRDPVFNSIVYDVDCEYYEQNTVSLNFSEEISPALSSGIDSVNLKYSVNGGTSTVLSMTLVQGNIRNGVWNATIPRQNYGDSISFNYTVTDDAGNSLVEPQNYGYTVRDHITPSNSSIQLDDDNNHDGTIEYFERATLRITVSEVSTPTLSSGILSVTLRYSFDNVLWTPVAMNLQSGDGVYSGLFNYTFNTLDWNTTVYYNISMVDNENNERISQTQNFTVYDTVKPTTGTPVAENTPVMYYQGGDVVIQLTEPTKAAGISSAILNYSSDGGAGWSQITMTLKNGTIKTGYWNATLPIFAYGTTVQFKVSATDRQGNVRISASNSFIVTDDIDPVVVSHVTSGSFTYYTPVDINVTVTEAFNASGVNSVELIYSVDGVLQTSISMELLTGNAYNGVWNATIAVQDYGSVVMYNFTATDAALNTLSGADNSQYTVDDDVDPIVNNVYFTDSGDGTIEYDESVEVIIDLSEATTPALSSGIATVYVNITVDNWVSSTTIPMNQKTGIDIWAGAWNCFLPTFNWSETLRFKVNVTDVAGNSIETAINSTGIEDLQDPSIGTPSVEGSPIEYDENINISVLIQEPVNSSGVDVVRLNYSYYGSVWNIQALTLDSGDEFSGTWLVNINIFLEYGTMFKYRIVANDSAGNEIISSQYQFVVGDLDSPTINDINLTDNGNQVLPVSYSERGIVKINVSEVTSPNFSSGIDLVQTYYDINSSGTWLPATTVKESFVTLYFIEIWNATIPRQNYGTYVRYYVTVSDKEGNSVTSSTYSYTVNDTASPTFGAITSVNTTYYQNSVVTGIVNEPFTPKRASGVALVQLNATYNGGGSWNLYSMSRITGTKFSGSYRVSLPDLNYNTNVTYHIIATDEEGNTAISSQYSFLILDNVKPVFMQVNQSFASPDYNDSQVIDVRITEGWNASGINQSRVILFYQNSSGTYNVSMVHYSGAGSPYLDDWWRTTIPDESQYGQNISYYIRAYDRAGNFNTSSLHWYLIDDTYDVDILDVPVVVNIPVEYDDNAIIRLNASEPDLASGINFIRLRWQNGTSGWQNVSMSNIGGDEYSGQISLNDYNTSIEWHVILTDLAGNVFNYSLGSNISIVDNTEPEFISYTTNPSPIEADRNTTIYATFTEPAGSSGLNTTLGSAKIHWNRTGGSNVSTGNVDDMVWNSSAGTFDYVMYEATTSETITFFIEVYDLAGNGRNTTIYSYIPNDANPPTIEDIGIPLSVEYYNQLNVTVNASDSGSGVNQVIVFYQINSTSGTWSNISASLIYGTSASGNWSVLLPRQSYGAIINIYIKAIDGIGRDIIDDNSSNYYSSQVIDTTAPIIDTIRVNSTVPASADIEYLEDANISVRVYKSAYTSLSARIVNVTLNYTISGSWIEVAMTRVSGTSRDGVWAALIPAQVAYNTQVNFSIYAEDDPGNSTVSPIESYTITDHQAPTYSNMVAVGSMYYEQINVSIRITRDVNASAIQTVTLSYLVDSSPFTAAMTLTGGTNQDGTWTATIGPFDWNEDIDLSIDCVDAGGNTLSSPAKDVATISIGDDVQSTIDSISNPGVVYYYGDVNITTVVLEELLPAESSGIDESAVFLNYTINGGMSWTSVLMTLVGSFNKFNSTFSAIIPEQDWNTTVDFKINVNDVAGNSVELAGTSYTVDDDVSPTITTFVKAKTDVYYHETVDLSANITEETTPKLAAGVVNATLHYRVNGGSWVVLQMSLISGGDY
ncbi:MAG: DUF7743 domain-containing protein, partial [Promethearchaeota archaeon]